MNRIPQARGLGSSSAAIVAGVLLARALAGAEQRFGVSDVLRLAARLEGHPDNVAPCLLGGVTIAWTEPDGARAVRLAAHERIHPVVFVPTGRGLTEAARGVLPDRVPHADAAFNVGRAALLVRALTAQPDLLFTATEDRLHQPYRAAGAPATAELVAALRRQGVAAAVSGAGPSVLALVEEGWQAPEPVGWQVWRLNLDTSGSVVTEGGRSGTLEAAERDPVAAGRAG
jgi:homoserine kinase